MVTGILGSGPDTVVLIPSTVEIGGTMYPVASVRYDAFSGKEMRSVTIGTVEAPVASISLGTRSFADIASLKAFTVYGDIGQTDWNIFKTDDGSTGLEAVEIHGSIGTLGGGALYKVDSLKTFTVYGDIGIISGNALFGTTSLETFTVYGGIGEISNTSFQGSGVKSVEIHGDVGIVNGAAFIYTDRLETFTVYGDIGTLGEKAFEGSGVMFVDVRGAIETMGSSVFYGNQRLISANLGHAVSIGSAAFGGSGLKNLTLSNDTVLTGENHFGDVVLESLYLNNAVSADDGKLLSQFG